jgi:hypothetical protein
MKQETISKYKLSAPKTVKTLRKLEWNVKNPHSEGLPSVTIPAGEQVQVYFSETNPSRLFLYHEPTDRVVLCRADSASKSFTGFRNVPGQRRLNDMVLDSVATTITGQRTEPDGYGADGSPSWLLVLGLI